MKLLFTLLLMLFMMLIACWSIKKLIECIINIVILIKIKKHLEEHSRAGSGIVFNAKKGRLESSGSKEILPF